jgi:acyl-coenzyme A thioesterase PaaI-like protein
MTAPRSIYELFQSIGFRDYHNDHGDVVVELPVAPHVVNTNGGLQGGLLATLVDIAAGKLAIEAIPPDVSVVTSDLSVRYLRPVRPVPPAQSRESSTPASAPSSCRSTSSAYRTRSWPQSPP